MGHVLQCHHLAVPGLRGSEWVWEPVSRFRILDFGLRILKQKSEDRCQKTDVRRQMSDVRSQRTDNRRQKSDFRGQMTEHPLRSPSYAASRRKQRKK